MLSKFHYRKLFQWFIPFFGMLISFDRRWLCDDAFFSFIYAKNLNSGLGFIFQTGESTEAISNLGWSLLLGVLATMGFDPMFSSQILGIFCYGFLIFLILSFEQKKFPERGIPLFSLSIMLQPHLQIFATSGLETMAFLTFIWIGFIYGEEGNFQISVLGFFISIFLRPEGMLAICFLPIFFGKRGAGVAILSIIFVCLLRYFLFYDFLPNTFYAKSGFFWKDGIDYLISVNQDYPLISILIPFFFIGKKYIGTRIFCIIYILYVISIGGDFMRMRFFLPIFTLFSWISYFNFSLLFQNIIREEGISKRLLKNYEFILSFIFVSALVISIPFGFNKAKGTKFWEERMVYNTELMRMDGYDQQAFQNLRVAFFGAQAHFIYHMPASYMLESESGLTDRELAETPSDPNKRPGHRKTVDVPFLEKKRIDLALREGFSSHVIGFNFRGHKLWFSVMNIEQIEKELCHRPLWDCSMLSKSIP